MTMMRFLHLATAVSFMPICLALRLQADETCRIATLIPFTDMRPEPPPENADPGVEYYGYGQWQDQAALAKASFSLAAAAEMARRHFNERNSVLVPELEILGYCNITFAADEPFDSWYLDSAYRRLDAVHHLMELWNKQEDPQNAVCAVIGPIDPRAAEGVSALTEQYNVPQVGYATIDERLNRRDLFPTYARIVPGAPEFSAAVAEYAQRDIWIRDYAGIVYADTEYGEQFESPLEDAEDTLGWETLTESFDEGADSNETIDYCLEEVVVEGYRTIILIADREAMIDDVAAVAESKGLLGPGYFWIISGDALPPTMFPTIRHEVDSPADKLLRGAAFFTNYDRFVYKGESDPFLAEWRKQDPSHLGRLNFMVPSRTYQAKETYYQDETPTEYASFMYDSIIATGISACEAHASGRNHAEQLLMTRFSGASGFVSFGEDDGEFSNSRDASNAIYGMHNIRPGEVDENNMRSYKSVLTALYENGSWTKVNGTEHIFFDDTPNEPMPLRTVKDFHYLSRSIFVVGLLLSSLAMFLCIGTAVWVFVHRNERLVRASQPEFLYLLCLGGMMVASSIVFISFDEDKGVTTDTLDIFCSAFTWDFVIGYLIMYCALFSKLWRLSKLMQMRRRVVKMQQVLVPFVVIMVASVAVLVVWQVEDPFVWRREIVDRNPLKTYGECESENAIYFVTPLGGLFVVIMTLTAVFAWNLRNVQEELSDSRWVFYGICSHLQTWAVGIPLAVITNDTSRDAYYIMFALFGFTFSVSLVSMVIWPKIYTLVVEKYFGGFKKKTDLTITKRPGGNGRVSGLNFSAGVGSNDLPSGESMPSRNTYTGATGRLSSRQTIEEEKQEQPP